MTEPPPGSLIGGCRLEDVLGRGGMGIVYRARQLRLDRVVALKVVAPELAGDPSFRERFERESRIAASLEHPHAVPVYEAGEDAGSLYIVMRLIDGPDLRRALQASPGGLGAQRASRIVGQIADALDEAHRRGLVHRDVKPANVLLEQRHDRGEHAYLTDFGLAKAVGSSGLTATSQWIGTMDYVAPEQIRGAEADARADIYSLGCVLYELLAGKPVFPRPHDAAKLWAHVNDAPPRPSDHAADVPQALDPVIARALAKDPDERHLSAGDFARAVDAALGGAAVSIPEGSVATGHALGDAASTQLAAQPRQRPPTSTRVAPAGAGSADPSAVARPRHTGRWAAIAGALVLAGGGLIAATQLGSGSSGGPGAGTALPTRPAGAALPPAVGGVTSRPPTTAYAGADFAARVPAGWHIVENEVPMSGFKESRWVSDIYPAAYLRVDYNPRSGKTAQQRAQLVENLASRTSGYTVLAFGPGDLPQPGSWRWIFRLPAVKRVDYFFNSCAGDFAVLGSAGPRRFTALQATFRQFAASVAPRCR
jgi:protein kinase-like protein